MRFCSLVQDAGSYLMPKEFSSPSCRGPKDLIGGVGEVGKTVLGLTKKELRRLKRKEKENLWRRNNRRNATPDPVVVHLPKEPPPRSALQTVHKETGKAREHHWYQGGLNHDWVGTYHRGITSDQSCVNEWNAMEGLESKRPPSPDSLTNKEETQVLIRSKLKEIMTSVDIDEVTSKYIRMRLEEDLKADLFQYKSFIDMEMLTILGQMDAATQIFPHVYLGSEWNASNLEELKTNGVGFILNVTKEIDNFFPGMFDYLNIRVYDDEKTELLRHWDDTFKYISQVKEKGSKVLVHCKMGISRSASVVIAYAMKAHNLSLGDATELVKGKRSCIKPNQAFTSQLKIYQGILDASRQRHNALFRSKSETNLKSTALNPSHSRLSYVPRGGAHSMPIPDFKPKPSASPNPSHCPSGVCESATVALQSSPTTLHVPPVSGRRPRSWSPDEETSKVLSLEPFEECDFGECLQKSRSLNDQAWQAHVTVVQRDLRDPGGGLVEALNPIYVPRRSSPSPTSSSQRLEELQLSSSVKERINEFESAKTNSSVNVGSNDKSPLGCHGNDKSPLGTHGNKKGPFAITLDDVTTHSSTDCGCKSDEGEEISEVDRPLLSPPRDPEEGCAEERPLRDASLDDEVVSPERSPCEAPVVVRNEPIPSGIVRKQKEDLEGKAKMSDRPPRAGRDPEGSTCAVLSRQDSSHSLNGVEGVREVGLPGGGEPLLGGKKEDPFSLRVDRVFDREEKDNGRIPSSVSGPKEGSPSRNNSWGSFDSAVVLPDRDAPSRQSSWGSCDTRLSGGSFPSRNSSFGAFDGKQHPAGVGYSVVPESGAPSFPQTNYVAWCFDKEILPLRRCKVRPLGQGFLQEEVGGATNLKEVGGATNLKDVGGATNLKEVGGATNLKAYAPMPFKMQPESDEKPDSPLSAPPIPSCRDPEGDLCSLTLIRSQPDGNYYSVLPGAGMKRGLKTSPQTPEHEIPLPGTVKQQRQKLENKSKQKEDLALGRLSVPSIGRSLSSGCVSSYSSPQEALLQEKKWHITRSCSEKRCKTDMEGAKGNVKKITRALETQRVSKDLPSPVRDHPCPLKASRSLKQKPQPKPNSILRSQSLERLGVGPSSSSSSSSPPSSPSSSSPPTPAKRGLSASLRRDQESSSQNFLDHLVGEAQAQVHLLEKEQEEINVRNLVDLFEDSSSERLLLGSLQQQPLHHEAEYPPAGENRLKRKASRPRSESMGERGDLLPPVPQRKSSLDYSARSAPRSPPATGVASLRQYASLSPCEKPPASSPLLTNGVAAGGPEKPSPSPPKLPPPQGGSRACGSEVRRRKQSGKSHPITKLTPRENTL